MEVSRHRRVHRSVAQLILLPVLCFLALAAWAMASPVGSSPDDDYHLASIWCGLGERDGLCEPGPTSGSRLVPESLLHYPCYAGDVNKNASCWSDRKQLAEVDTLNAVSGGYPPVFYATMSVFASSNVEASVLAMRLFNAALFVGLVTATAYALPGALRRSVVVPFVATIVPLGAFCVASTNPSSWAYLSAGIVWPALYGSTCTTGRRRWLLALLAVFGAFIGAGARADAGVYACFAVVVVAILALRRSRNLLIPGVAAAAILVIGVVFYLTSGQGAAAMGGLNDATKATSTPLSLGATISTFLDVPNLWFGSVGGWGLGWLDVPMPQVVPVLGWAVLGGICLLGLGVATKRTTFAAVLALAAVWLVPTYLQYQTGALVGQYIQPRYVLPLLVILVGVSTVATRRGWLEWSRLQGYVVVAALSITAAVALFTTIHRFTVGLNAPISTVVSDPQWWWNSGPGTLGVLMVGTIAAVGALFVAERMGRVGGSRFGGDATIDGKAPAESPLLSDPA